MKKIAILLIILFAAPCFAQFSKTHYFPPITSNSNMPEDHYLYISTPSTTNVKFKIIENGGTIIQGVVSNAVPYVYTIGTGVDTQMLTPKTNIGKLTNKGYIIEAEDLVYVSMRINASLNPNNGTFAHAGGIVSKGNSALGKIFRLGAMLNPSFDFTLLNFASILSTENNTTIRISNIPSGTLLTDGTIVNGPIVVTLDKNESYVIALENQNQTVGLSNSAKIIGALVESDKPVVVNSGSFGGSNSTATNFRDIGFDQIVSLEKTGKEYIFVRGLGSDLLERVLLVSHTNGTKVFINGSTTVFTTLNAGEYADIDGSNFINGNFYVTTSEPVFAYQSIGGKDDNAANQNLFFVPPISCTTPRVVDNIPAIQSIGNTAYIGGLNIITEKGASVSVNNIAVTTSPVAVTGNPGFERYTINSLYGNVSVKSTKQVYVSYFGTNSAATFGGYYSGFDSKPEVILNKISASGTSCIPNTILKTSDISSYDAFQWFFNGNAIAGATANQYTPTQSGYYIVRGSITGCPSTLPLFSDNTPVSQCTTDFDNDNVNDDIDNDLDNDGIVNCSESYGDKSIDTAVSGAGNITVNDYSNTYTSLVSTSVDATVTPFVGNADGSFVTETPIGVGNFVDYKMTFAKPITIGMQYVATANASDLINANAEYVVTSDVDKTVTVLNPSNQLLIDTNYDGIYESGITEYSSFEVRFRLNGTTSLTAGTGDFKFLSYLTKSFSITHKNLSDTNDNKSTFKCYAACVPKDSDGDGTADLTDTDSDNDGILDITEAQVDNAVALSNSDTNRDGIDNVFGTGLTAVDTDKDGVPDYLDLDSDNDGILDKDESGSLATNADIDNDGINNYRELDSDNDLCLDVKEAGFSDPDLDGIVNTSPVTVDINGKVIGAPYTAPMVNYKIAAPLTISQQPLASPTCELQNTSIKVISSGDSYQWQVSTDGTSWNDLVNNTTYAGVTTANLLLNGITNSMNGYKYRVSINRTGNSCGLISNETSLTVYVLPNVVTTEIKQCDEDLDGITAFNLTVKNNFISANASNEIFTYYLSQAGANTANPTQLISNPEAFINTTPFTMVVWARVTNSNNCYRVAQLNLKVVATQIPSSFKRTFEVCDDNLDMDGNYNSNNNKRDGISAFNFSSVETEIRGMLPTVNSYTIRFYKSQADALVEKNQITNLSNYRNIDSPNTQQIWGRVDSNIDNGCYGFGPFVTLNVEKLPTAHPVTIDRQCDDDQDDTFLFNTSALESTLLNGQNNVTATYYDATYRPLKDANGVSITSPFPARFFTKSQKIIARLTNNTTLKCLDETSITFIVDDLPEAYAIPTSLTTICDDEADPLLQDGKYTFDTSSFQNTILGSQAGMMVEYFDKNNLALSSPLPNPFTTATDDYKIVVKNQTNTGCEATKTLSFVVNPLPRIRTNYDNSENQLICSSQTTFNTQVNAGFEFGTNTADYKYVWTKDNQVLTTETSPDLFVDNAEGNYNVQVINRVTGCSRDRNVKVTFSEKPQITSVEVIDFTDVNSIRVNAIGRSKYEFSVDERYNFFQASNLFDNIPAGVHEVYVNDTKGCGTVSQTVSVIGVPKFFTPNNDGFNDYWNVKGISTNLNSQSIIHIYDRYGKLVLDIDPLGQGWDGTLNGFQLPADDYWYTLKLQDGRESKGHFTLKR